MSDKKSSLQEMKADIARRMLAHMHMDQVMSRPWEIPVRNLERDLFMAKGEVAWNLKTPGEAEEAGIAYIQMLEKMRMAALETLIVDAGAGVHRMLSEFRKTCYKHIDNR